MSDVPSREIQFEVWQGDLMVAASSDEADARHYAAVYGQDGPVQLVRAETIRTPLDSTPAAQDEGLTDGQYEPDDFGPVGDAARRIASYCEGEARQNVYRAAKIELSALPPPEPWGDVGELVEALAKIMPIRVHDGPDYAEVYFADGQQHSTQAMSMHPNDWRDIHDAYVALAKHRESRA